MDQAVDHAELNELLGQCGSSFHASQAHGLLCSRLSVAGLEGAASWTSEVLAEANPENAKREQCAAMLGALWRATRRQLVERQFELALLLPGDHDPIVDRAVAMGSWCEGFLQGLVSQKLSDKLKERLAAEPLSGIINDMLQITRAAPETEDEDDEVAFAELVEYIRVATLLTYEELSEFREPGEDSASDGPETVH